LAKILAVDTSAGACSVAIYGDGICAEDFVLSPRDHTRKILPMVDSILAGQNLNLKDIDAIAFGRGPGSFTGLRIAAGVVQGLAFGSGLPVMPVSSLAAVAQGWIGEQAQFCEETICVAFDARMSEVYFGSFQSEAGYSRLVGDELVSKPGKVELNGLTRPIVALGSGWNYAELLAETDCLVKDCSREVRALDIAILGEQQYLAGHSVSAEQAVPVYLRNEVSWKKLADQ
jgi:tRNA threonylcarbamoyladenosine biosynthesis protein TsaB